MSVAVCRRLAGHSPHSLPSSQPLPIPLPLLLHPAIFYLLAFGIERQNLAKSRAAPLFSSAANAACNRTSSIRLTALQLMFTLFFFVLRWCWRTETGHGGFFFYFFVFFIDEAAWPGENSAHQRERERWLLGFGLKTCNRRQSFVRAYKPVPVHCVRSRGLDIIIIIFFPLGWEGGKESLHRYKSWHHDHHLHVNVVAVRSGTPASSAVPHRSPGNLAPPSAPASAPGAALCTRKAWLTRPGRPSSEGPPSPPPPSPWSPSPQRGNLRPYPLSISSTHRPIPVGHFNRVVLIK